MKKLLIASASFVLGMAVSFSAVAADKTLGERHGPAWPKSTNGYVTKAQCMQCHGDYEKLGKQTEGLTPNPHRSHLGQVDCQECHKAETSKPEIMCTQCHKFEIKPVAKKN